MFRRFRTVQSTYDRTTVKVSVPFVSLTRLVATSKATELASSSTTVIVFVPMLPLLAVDFDVARYVIGAWMLMYAVTGWALLREEGESR